MLRSSLVVVFAASHRVLRPWWVAYARHTPSTSWYWIKEPPVLLLFPCSYMHISAQSNLIQSKAYICSSLMIAHHPVTSLCPDVTVQSAGSDLLGQILADRSERFAHVLKVRKLCSTLSEYHAAPKSTVRRTSFHTCALARVHHLSAW
jgi:hypothetical protein